ncbi:MAG: Nif3-like dinuclear metal center hexameric protein [Candidatus Marinimicrobia bacterium]|nr:Nif3-like dinuclear metal center hexameric protein [Candidatus Neomarinimicrobiota bacterium]MDD5710411.1 Nif3-like dinuclear metal center hexameric protein [Candidatus Neomarinimicrobiota bacterium]
MISRQELADYLEQLFRYEDYEDHCRNGLQVEGKDSIRKIAFAVSYNLLSVKEAAAMEADALIVHHGIFGKDFFHLGGREKIRIKALLDAGISLFGIHLPLDAHRELGNNAQLAACLSAGILEPFEVGFILNNSAGLSFQGIMQTLYQKLGGIEDVELKPEGIIPGRKYGMDYCAFGPEIPQRIACISGGAGSYYEAALKKGIDTFIAGDIREQIPAIAFESRTNYLNIGHFRSEIPGISALQHHLEEKFQLETAFILIHNRI